MKKFNNVPENLFSLENLNTSSVSGIGRRLSSPFLPYRPADLSMVNRCQIFSESQISKLPRVRPGKAVHFISPINFRSIVHLQISQSIHRYYGRESTYLINAAGYNRV